MEKIQEAIAKARALRETAAPAMAQDGAAVPPPLPTPPAAMATPVVGGTIPGAPAFSAAPVAAPVVAPVAAPVAAPQPVQSADVQMAVADGVARQLAAPALSADVMAARWNGVPEFVPGAGLLRRHRVMTVAAGKPAADFDGIRTRMLQMQRANGWRRIAITSPGPGCGKSTLALNLAFSLARQPDQFTIVAEMDLRRPTLASMLGARQKHDFAAVLRGEAKFEDNAFRAAPNLIFATNAGPVKNSSELLQGQSAAAALDAIEAHYQPTTILFDMPPLLSVDDTMGFLARVDAVILVAAAEQTSIKQIDLCESEIARQTNVMGVVLNKCRYMDREQRYDYGY